MRIAVVPFLVLLVTGCESQPRLDTSSDAAFQASLDRMANGMTDEEKSQLVGDVFAVAVTQSIAQASDGLRNQREKKDLPAARLVILLNGMTADEIHAKAEKVRRARPKK
jgi:hypothetical protein